MGERAVRYVFVTGGVVSGLGKGITAASLGTLLKARGLKVSLQKCDPYLNVDPGTMSPYQHGEVYVTEDGAETDLDLGHYERFTDENLSRDLQRDHRRGLRRGHQARAPGRLPRPHGPGHPARHRRDQGPHPPGRAAPRRPTWSSSRSAARWATSSRCRSSRPSARCATRRAASTCAFVHVTLVPFLDSVGELKTKTTQHSVNELRGIGIEPDVLVLRSDRPLTERRPREDRALRRHPDATRSSPRSTRRTSTWCRWPWPPRASTPWSAAGSACDAGPPDLAEWRRAGAAARAPAEGRVRIALVGKYVQLHDAYLSVTEALKHAVHPPRGRARRSTGSTPRTPDLVRAPGRRRRRSSSPAASASRGIEGKIAAARYARERGVPYLGHLPGHAGGGHRVRPPRLRHGGGQLQRVRPRDARTR